MPAATILFTDMVGFSRKPTDVQRLLVNDLVNEVLCETRHLLHPPFGSPEVIALPTGDGMALAFLDNPGKQWDRSTIFGLIFRLQKWALSKKSKRNGDVKLRIGVHVGQVELITDINNRANVCGDTINYAQRVMDAANDKQVLFSEAAFREYVGLDEETSAIEDEPFLPQGVNKANFKGPIETFAKHGLYIPVYKMVLDPQQDYWDNGDPIAKHLMVVKLTMLPKDIVPSTETTEKEPSFGKTLEEANDAALIQLTGYRLIENLRSGAVKLSENLKRFWVFMPDPEAYKNLHITAPYHPPAELEAYIKQWKEFLKEFKANRKKATLKLGLFKEPPNFGASFLDWERPGGKIHISAYIWNLPTPECPGYDLEWKGSKPSSVYEAYVSGLRYLDFNTKNSLAE